MREFCPALTNKTYFNYGGQGPLPGPSLDAITASWRRIQELGPFTNNVWDYIQNETNNTRQQLAALCGVPPELLHCESSGWSTNLAVLCAIQIVDVENVPVVKNNPCLCISTTYNMFTKMNLT